MKPLTPIYTLHQIKEDEAVYGCPTHCTLTAWTSYEAACAAMKKYYSHMKNHPNSTHEPVECHVGLGDGQGDFILFKINGVVYRQYPVQMILCHNVEV